MPLPSETRTRPSGKQRLMFRPQRLADNFSVPTPRAYDRRSCSYVEPRRRLPSLSVHHATCQIHPDPIDVFNWDARVPFTVICSNWHIQIIIIIINSLDACPYLPLRLVRPVHISLYTRAIF